MTIIARNLVSAAMFSLVLQSCLTESDDPSGSQGQSLGSHTKMSEACSEIIEQSKKLDGMVLLPTPGGSVRLRFEPNSDAKFKQILVGFNGPSTPDAIILESKESANNSWLRIALGQDALAGVLCNVDFENQILVAFLVGKRTTATGALLITDVSYDVGLKSFLVVGDVGVNERDCNFPPTKSYPFALVVVKKPPEVPENPGYWIRNFGDGCKPPKSGNPNN